MIGRLDDIDLKVADLKVNDWQTSELQVSTSFALKIFEAPSRYFQTTCLWLQCHSSNVQQLEAELADLREILDKDPLWKLGTTWEFKAGTQSSQFHRIP